MKGPTSKTTAVFAEPFSLPGLDELLPAGEYDLETEIDAPPDHLDPERWKASVMVRLHPRHSHPGLRRTLTVPLCALDHALARDKLTGRGLVDFFIEEMLSDPMVRLVMTADRVSEAEIRQLYARTSRMATVDDSVDDKDTHDDSVDDKDTHDDSDAVSRRDRQGTVAVQPAGHEGMPPRTPPPG